MACPGGCIAGGGQPRTAVPPQDWVRQARIDTIYAKDKEGKILSTKEDGGKKMTLQLSHMNPEIDKIYKEFLGEPLSHLAHELCHTTYASRAEALNPKEV